MISYITNKNNIYSHSNNIKYELLVEHCKLTKKYYEFIINNNKLDTNINKLIDIINPFNKYNELIKEMFIAAIEFHDIGKCQYNFQLKIKNGNNSIEENSIEEHSIFSGYIFLCHYLNKIKNSCERKERFYLNYFAYSFSYIISKHHSRLDNDFLVSESESFKCKLSKIDILVNNNSLYLSNLKDLPKYNESNFKVINKIECFILCKLLFSLLISSDYYATSYFFNDINIDDFGLFDNNLKNEFNNCFENFNIVKNIRTNNHSLPINKLRSEIFLQSEYNLINNINNNLFFLKSPTGSGKTINSINLALKTINKTNISKIFYVFPFNTLIDQTAKTVFNIFNKFENNIAIINSITPIKENYIDNNINYLNNINLNYQFNIISHITLFNILFGTSKNNCLPFYALSNSIIIIDEIQAYSINLWKEIIMFFDLFAKYLNIKFIFMSATLPKFNLLNDINIIDLLPNSHKYFINPIFKNRVNMNFDLLNINNSIDSIISFLNSIYFNFNKILIEFQSKSNCREFYNKIINKYKEYKIFELTSFDNSYYREKIIKLLSNKEEKVIIVCTQIIEAGVDIDVDLGLKEISCLESEEQFLGRINRSCKRENCYAYFFKLQNSKIKYIYKNDIRIKKNLMINKFYIQDFLVNKNFDDYYDILLKDLNFYKTYSSIEYDNFLNDINLLKFKNISDYMQLINNNTISIFIPSIINNINGYVIWNKYISIINNPTLSFCNKKICLSKLSPLLNYFTYTIYNNNLNLNKLDFLYGYYFVPNGSSFIDSNCKFNYNDFIQWLKK